MTSEQYTKIVSTRRGSTPHIDIEREVGIPHLELARKENDGKEILLVCNTGKGRTGKIYKGERIHPPIVGAEARHCSSFGIAEREALRALLTHGKDNLGADAYELTGLISMDEEDGDGCFGYATAIFYSTSGEQREQFIKEVRKHQEAERLVHFFLWPKR